MIWIGTSGFQYREWKGSFYPEELPVAKMLGYYAAHFPTTEINYTFHRMPNAKTVQGWFAATPDAFRFVLKAPQQITHVRRLKDCASALRYFSDVTAGLGPKRGPILFQLPPFLKRDQGRLEDFLVEFEAIAAEVPAAPPGVEALPAAGSTLNLGSSRRPPLLAAFEFRDPSWWGDATLELLRRHHAALCIAETDERCAPVEFTAEFGYLRLRATQYGPAELGRWAQVIRERAGQVEDVFVFFKHEEAGKGPAFARALTERLADLQAAA